MYFSQNPSPLISALQGTDMSVIQLKLLWTFERKIPFKFSKTPFIVLAQDQYITVENLN